METTETTEQQDLKENQEPKESQDLQGLPALTESLVLRDQLDLPVSSSVRPAQVCRPSLFISGNQSMPT